MNNLSDEARKLRNAYNRNWKKKNPEKSKQYQINYWERKAAEYSPMMKVKELHEMGLNQREIAKKLGVSVGTVYNYLHRN